MPDWTCPECGAQHVKLKGRTCPDCGYIRPKLPSGFASMRISPDRQRQIARQGGIASQASGKGHKFTSAEAKAAGKKSGKLKQDKARERRRAKPPATTEEE